MISVPSGSLATSSAARACCVRLYSTTGGQALGGASEPAIAQALNEIVAAIRAAAGGVQHLALYFMGILRCCEAFSKRCADPTI
jgi:hypothetical protein